MQKQIYGIAIFEDEIVLEDCEKNQRYLVNREQLMQFFEAEITFKPFPGLIWMKSSGLISRYLFTLPTAKHALIYHPVNGENQVLKVALPNLLILVGVAHGKITGMSLWGYKGEINDSTKLYELPLPNISGSHICLGANDIPARDIVAATKTALFDTPFNTHNYLVGKESIPFPAYVIQHKGRCPFKTLKPLGIARNILGGWT